MKGTHQIAFDRSQLKEWIAFTSEVSAARWPTPTAIMNSDIAWQLQGSDPKNNVRLWRSDSKIKGFGWFQPPGHLIFDCHPEQEDQSFLIDEILNWAIERREKFGPGGLSYLNFKDMDEWADAIQNPAPASNERSLVVSALESDARLLGILNQFGFSKTEHFEPMLSHDLTVDAEPLTELTVRPVMASEYEAFLDAHRQAWAPSTGLSMDKYLAVRGMTAVFDPELNLIAVENGEIQACCIFWRDDSSKIGSLEPFGTAPGGRGRGISQALIKSGLVKLRQSGMEHCRIYTAGFNHQAQKLYQSCGFKEVDRLRTYIKKLE
jgi:ribosomal protein S18 acetylase RimI-like enzyme